MDHLIKDCANVCCVNCEQSGHRVAQCEELPMCSICRSTDHVVHECPYFLYSVNVEPVASQSASVPNLYAGAATGPCTVPFNSTLPSTKAGYEKVKE